MKYTVALQNLPFLPDKRQVVYVENVYNDIVNQTIIDHIELIGSHFRSCDLEFVYIPFLGADRHLEERVRYHAPYLTSDITYEQLPQSSLLLNCMVHPETRAEIRPSLLIYDHSEGKERHFTGWTIDEDIPSKILSAILNFADEFGDFCESGLAFSAADEDEKCCFEIAEPIQYKEEPPSVKFNLPPTSLGMGFLKVKRPEIREVSTVLPYEEDEPLEALMDNLQSTVKRLQLHGISLAALHELIDKQAPLSRMRITADYRIFLPDYNNMEIKMTTLPKALFFLFLRYPEGIVLKTLPDYYTELYNIYKQLRPKSNDERIRVTITELVNPFGNKINENIARIRAPFVEKFDEHLAQNYFVTGRKGERYLIRLDRDMIDWDE